MNVDEHLDTLEDRLVGLITPEASRHGRAWSTSASAEARVLCEAAATGRPVDLSTASQDVLLYLMALVTRFDVDYASRGEVAVTGLDGLTEPGLALLLAAFDGSPARH